MTTIITSNTIYFCMFLFYICISLTLFPVLYFLCDTNMSGINKVHTILHWQCIFFTSGHKDWSQRFLREPHNHGYESEGLAYLTAPLHQLHSTVSIRWSDPGEARRVHMRLR